MFGRVRLPSSSPDSLERPHLKIVKDDDMSIYEKTLMKLKLGSKLDLGSLPESGSEPEADCISPNLPECFRVSPLSEAAKKQNTSDMPSNEKGAYMATDCSSAITSECSSNSRSTFGLKQKNNGNLSVLHLFSKYKNPMHVQHSYSSKASAKIENEYSSSGSISQTYSNRESLIANSELSEDECISSVPICSM